MLTTREKLALNLAKKAGKIIKDNFRVVTKNKIKEGIKGNVVTEIDVKVNNLYLEAIRKNFPGDAIISEEEDEICGESGYTWLIDPLDGTRNFIKGTPLLGTIVGIAKGDNMEFGVVYDPLQKDLMRAKRGEGAFLNDKRIRVSKEDELKEAIMYLIVVKRRADKKYLYDVFKNVTEYTTWLVNFGSAVSAMLAVCTGRLDVLYTAGAWPWDLAAGSLIASEAGAMVSDLSGNKFDFRKNPSDIVIANKKLHQLFMEKILNVRH